MQAWGETRKPEYMAKAGGGHNAPMLEDPDLEFALPESVAIIQYLCRKHGITGDLYPEDTKRRALVESALAYHGSHVYQFVAKAAYPTVKYSLYPGDVCSTDGMTDEQKLAAQKAAVAHCTDDIFKPLEGLYIKGGFIGGGESPSIADIRIMCTLMFMTSIEYEFSEGLKAYMEKVQTALGEAFTAPSGDFTGYLESVKAALP